MIESHPQPEIITKLLDAVYPSFALLAGMQLDLFTKLKEEPLSAEKLAQAIGVQTYKLQPLLFILVQAGLLDYEDYLFSNTPETSHYLVNGKPTYLGKRMGLTFSNWRRMLSTADTIRAGKPQVAYDDPSSHEDLVEVFRGLYPGAVADAKLILDQHDFTDCEMFLDVGGGSGGLGITIAEAHPHLKTTIIDLPSVTPITKIFVDNANANDQIEIITADAINDTLSGAYDVVVARHLFQVLSKEDAQKLMNKLARIIVPGGKLFIIGYILEDSRLAPSQAVDFNLVLITSSEYGEAYAEHEYKEWLRVAGFVGFTRKSISNGASFISAQLPSKR